MEIYVDDEAKLTLHGLTQKYVKLEEDQKNRKLFDLLDEIEFNQVRARVGGCDPCCCCCCCCGFRGWCDYVLLLLLLFVMGFVVSVWRWWCKAHGRTYRVGVVLINL